MEPSAIERLFRRLQAMFGRGRLTFVDDSGPVQKMQVRMSGLEVFDNRPRLLDFGFSSNPPLGADIYMVSASGDRGGGTVFATNHQESRPRGLLPGESMQYSKDGKRIYLTASGGIVIEAKGQDVAVNDAANVVWNCSGDFTLNLGGKFKVVAPGGSAFETPNLASTGDIQDQSTSNTETMATMRANYNSHGHPVTNVQPGSATITSQTPTVPM